MKQAFYFLNQYCENHSSPQSDLLYALDRETHLKTLAPQMSSGHLQGRFLSFLSKLIQPETILEIGTFTGYAAICMAEGLQENGVLHTIEVNRELEYLIRKYLKEGNFEDKIKLHIGDAKTIIPTLPIKVFDLVFIDAGKKDNDYYFEMVLPMVKKGGLILIDNVLWDGKVTNNLNDSITKQISGFNQKVSTDQRVESLMLPIRDGMLLLRKR